MFAHQLGPSCNVVATSSTDVEATDLIPLTDFTANEPVYSSFLIIFCRPSADIGPQTFLLPLNERNFFKAANTQSFSCKRVSKHNAILQ
ncbi:hypothetical protein CEXT_431821 [Caerostris extrusa]|uniref:Uncharacterized protein n=1 Tax=Caerostris extrusa TaxID=172846 RepID=A0AAV4TFT0_CAEEX|nr:hypothetical protein CEXT_431821 [Caerostris extrusa]